MARPIKTKSWPHKIKKPVLVHFLTFEIDGEGLEQIIKKNRDLYSSKSHFCRAAVIYMAKHRHNVDLVHDRAELLSPLKKDSELVKKFKQNNVRYNCIHPDYATYEEK